MTLKTRYFTGRKNVIFEHRAVLSFRESSEEQEFDISNVGDREQVEVGEKTYSEPTGALYSGDQI